MEGSKPRVLVVDDEPSVRRICERVLVRAGFEVVSAGDGDEALALLAEQPGLALILLDASMPKVGGLRVLEVLRERGLTTPVIWSSGFSDLEPPSSEAFPNLRANLAKPYQVAQLLACVDAVLGTGP